MSGIDLQFLSERESEQVEWKENVADIGDVVCTISAFANDFSNLGGGYVVCGAKETIDANGFQKVDLSGLTAKRLKEIAGKVLADCSQRIDPPVVPTVTELSASTPDRRILVFTMPATGHVHTCRKREQATNYYIRVGQNTREARNGLLRELLVKKGALEAWDQRINNSAGEQDIDLLILQNYLQRMGIWDNAKPIEHYLREPLYTFLSTLFDQEALTGIHKPRNFALLMFNKAPARFFSGAYSIFSQYAGIDRSAGVASQLEILGPVIEQAEKLIDLLTLESPTMIDKSSATPNQEKYPQKAFKEAVVNAVVHRDYEFSREPVRVTVFTDRVEIRSPGTLPRTIEHQTFKAGNSGPYWRNKNLSYFFNKLQLAQGEGSGIPAILQSMGKQRCDFEIGKEHLVCTLFAHSHSEPKSGIFISFAGDDRAFATLLRQKLEAISVKVWLDARELTAGDPLSDNIEKHIRQASAMVVLLSVSTVNSPWVRKEIQMAATHHIETIPLLLPRLAVGALGTWFDSEPLAIEVPSADQLGLNAVFDQVLAALKLQLPNTVQPPTEVDHQPISELVLRLKQLTLEEVDNTRRAKAIAQVIYTPAQFSAGAREVESPEFIFTAPLGPIEGDDIRWYLEQYVRWPSDPFKRRAEAIEVKLPQWGQALYHAAFGIEDAREVAAIWMRDAQQDNRRFSVWVDEQLPLGSDVDEQAIASEAASLLLALPWELLHQEGHYWFVGKNPVRVRRRLPNRKQQDVRQNQLPIRILLLSPRPEEDGVSYIDHRASALPLVGAIEQLGDLAALTILNPPTFPRLRQALADAEAAGEPFDVVHFDGHGVYRQEHNQVGLGGLCFENPDDDSKLTERRMTFIDAQAMAGLVKDYRIPLVFLEACQTAKSELDPTTSVVGKLLGEGVSSVVAMSHSVLVTTATQFVTAFYQALASGKSIGAAMLAGQLALHENTWRGKTLGIGDFHLQDWFVPVLYQETQDPLLVTQLPSKPMKAHQEKEQRSTFGALPESPKHEFVGRSRELLALERLLEKQPYAVIRGQGGAGKTTLAVELARWLVRSHRFAKSAFVSLAQYTNARGVLDALGRQLLNEHYSVAEYGSLEQALQPVARVLQDHTTLIVLDNLESLLPTPNTLASDPIPEAVKAVLSLCQTLSTTDHRVRFIFTSREAMPEPFDHPRSDMTLGALNWQDAVQVVSQVMENAVFEPKAADPGATLEEIRELVEAVHCHARALVLCAQEIGKQGVRATTAKMGRLEEAVAFYQQATDIHLKLQDKMGEGSARHNLADQFLTLKRYDEARQEVHQAIACKKPYGHAAEPWKSWDILYELEQATQHPKAAKDTRQKAIQSFSAYREAGGENHQDIAQLCRQVEQAIQENNVTEAEAILAQYTQPSWQLVISKLHAIINGERDSGLADDPDLDYMAVVELKILLQHLA